MRKTVLLFSMLVICITSCTKNFDSINTNPNRFYTPDFDPVITTTFKLLTDQMENNNALYLWEYGHMIEPIGGRYAVGDATMWSTCYISVIGNIRQLENLYGSNPAYSNRMAIAHIWESYAYYQLVSLYGPVPYSQAGTTGPSILYDDENTIYTSLLSKLKADGNAITIGKDNLTTDFIFGGDLTKWKKFANTLRLKIALQTQRSLGSVAVDAIKDVMSNEALLPQSDADDAKLTYGTATGSQAPYYTRWVLPKNATDAQNLTSGPLMSDYVYTYFRSYKDPRVDAYFNKSQVPPVIRDTLTSTADALHHIVTYPIPQLGYPKFATPLTQWGITTSLFITGGLTVVRSYSTLPGLTQLPITTTSGVNLMAPDRAFYHTTYADVCFMKAEAAQLGYGGSQSASAYYYAGINANFAFWGLTAAQAAAYEAQPGIAWSTAGHGFNYNLGFINTSIPADNMTKIWIQQWINYFDDGGLDAYNLQRRTQNLVLPPHTNPGTPNLSQYFYADLPDRWPYPTSETTVNPVGVADGIKKLGGLDFSTTQLKFAAPFTHPNWATARAFVDDSYIHKFYGNTIQDLTAKGIAYTQVSTY